MNNTCTLAEKELVHIWEISLAETELDLPELLSDDELARFGSISHQPSRIRFLRSRAALRLILASYLGRSAAGLNFIYGENGKPELATATIPAVFFNLSHTGNRCLLAVTAENNVGIDIEKFQSGRDHAALAERFFFRQESLLLENNNDVLFYWLWTLKEASVKAFGMKLLAGLDRFECQSDGNGGFSVVDKQLQQQNKWSMKQWQPDANSVAAVVVDSPRAEFIEKILKQEDIPGFYSIGRPV